MRRKFFSFVGGDCVRHIFVCDKKSHNDLCEWFRLFPYPHIALCVHCIVTIFNNGQSHHHPGF